MPGSGVFTLLMASQVLPTGSKRAPLVRPDDARPPQPMARLPLQTMASQERATGAPLALIGCQVSLTGSYMAPSPRFAKLGDSPPQISRR